MVYIVTGIHDMHATSHMRKISHRTREMNISLDRARLAAEKHNTINNIVLAMSLGRNTITQQGPSCQPLKCTDK